MATPDFKSQVLKCVKSPDDFRDYSRPVREELLKQNKEKIKIYLDTVTSVVGDKKADAISRFFSLYFLKVTTEHSNPTLISQLFLRTAFLKLMEEYAIFEKDKNFPERGSVFFNSQPKEIEKTTGSNFIALLLEMIKYWNLKYGNTVSAAKEMYQRLSEVQKVPFPETFFYYKIQPGVESPLKPPAQKQTQQLPTQSNAPPEQGNSKLTSSKQGTVKEVKEDDTTKFVASKIIVIKNLKNELRVVYEENKEGADAEVLNFFYEDLRTANKELSGKMDYFLNNTSSENEAIFNDMIHQTEQATTLSTEFQRYSSKKVTWLEHRTAILAILRGNEKSITPGSTVLSGTQNKTGGLEEELKMAGEAGATFGQVHSESGSEIPKLRAVGNLEEEKYEVKDPKNSKLRITETTSQFIPPKEAEKKIIASESIQKNEKVPNHKMQESVKKTNLRIQTSPNNEIDSHEANKPKIFVVKADDKDKTRSSHEKPKEGGKIEEKKLEEKKTEEKISKKDNKIPDDDGDGKNEEKRVVAESSQQKTHHQPLGEKHTNKSEIITKDEKEKSKLDPMQLMKEHQNNKVPENEATGVDAHQKVMMKQSNPTGRAKLSESKTEEKQNLPPSQPPRKTPTQSTEKRLSVSEKRPSIREKREENVPESEISTTETPFKERGQQREGKGMVSLFKLDQSSVSDKFASELKMMEQSIRATRDRSSDMDRIRDGIRQSFINRNRKPPTYQELVDKNVLKNLEEQLEKIKKEKQKISEQQAQGFVTPVKMTHEEPKNNIPNEKTEDPKTNEKTEDPKIKERMEMLEKQCEDYQKNMELLQKKNEELALRLKQMQSESSTKNREDKQKAEQEIQKFKEDKQELLERIQRLEVMLKKPAQKIPQRKNSEDSKMNNQGEKPRELTEEKAKQGQKIMQEEKVARDEKAPRRESISQEDNIPRTESISRKEKIPQRDSILRENKASREDKILRRESIPQVEKVSQEDKSSQEEKVPRRESISREEKGKREEFNNENRRQSSETPMKSKVFKIVADKSTIPAYIQYNKGPSFHRSGRMLKNERVFPAPATLKTDSSEGDVSTVMIFEDLTNTMPQNNIFGRGHEPIEVKIAEDYYSQQNDFHYQPQRGINHRRLKIARKQEVPRLNTVSALFRQDFQGPVFETPVKRNNFYCVQQLSPTAQDPETLIEKDRIKRAEAWQRASARSSTKTSARQHRAEERSYSPPTAYIEENKRRGMSENKTNFSFREKDVFESETDSGEWQMNVEQVSGEVYVLKEIKARLQTAGSFDDFKLNCLKPKGILFETDSIQVGFTISIYKRHPSSASHLQVIIQYGNKLNDKITEFRTSHSQGLNLDIIAQPEMPQSVINSNQQARQQLIVGFNQVPFGCLQLTCEGLFGASYSCFSFYLPTVITKFMEFKRIELKEFSLKWKRLEKKVIKTEPISLNSSILRFSNDFKKYFNHLIDLRVQSEGELVQISKETRLGGLFELHEPGVEYLLSISILQNNTVIFQIASQKRNSSVVRYLLQTLIFLFKG